MRKLIIILSLTMGILSCQGEAGNEIDALLNIWGICPKLSLEIEQASNC